MTPEQKVNLKEALRIWVICFAVVSGFLFYHSTASLSAVLLGGGVALVVAVGRVFFKRRSSLG